MAGATQFPTVADLPNRHAPWLRRFAANWLPLGLAWLAFALRVSGITAQSLWRDEVDTLRFAMRPLSEALAMFGQDGQNGPLFFLGLRPWLMVMGPSEFALRFPSALAGALAVPVCYALVSRLVGRKPAALTAFLMAIAPYLVWYGQEAKMYAALTLLAPASLWLTVEAARHGRWWRWALLYLVTTLAIYIHVLAALIVPVQVLWLRILPFGGRPGRRWRPVAAYLAALCLPYLPLVVWQADMWLSTFETGHRFVPLGDIVLILFAVFSLGVQPSQSFLSLLPFMLALVAGGLLWAFQARNGLREGTLSRGRAAALLLVWLGLPPLLVFGVSLGMPIFTERYLIWVMPPFLALIALGVSALARLWRPLGLVVLATIAALDIGGVVTQAGQPIKSDFRSAAHYVVQRVQPGDLLLYQIPYVRYTFTYYSSGRGDPNDTTLRWLDGPYTNRGMTEAEVDALLTTGAGAAPAVWLIASETPMWDERGLTAGWLATHGVVDAQAEFARVTVTRYELR